MMLLNNDYYLDMKETLMSQELSAVISNTNILYDELREHINNQSLHGNKGVVINNVYNSTTISSDIANEAAFIDQGILTSDTVVYLSISDSVTRINEKINNVPHNLNGHNLAFIFVIPEGYENGNEADPNVGLNSNYYEYSIDVGDQCIKFSNFMNGTLFVFGDFIAETKIVSNNVESVNFPSYSEKSKEKIDDPVKYDGVIPESYIERLYKEVDNPEQIDEIIYYNSEDAKSNLSTRLKKNLNKIVIKGTCLNKEYSVICFSDITAKTYVKNLKFVNTLKADNDGVIDIIQQLNSGLPSKEQVMFQYPLNEDLKPNIYKPFYSYLQTVSNEPYFNLVSSYVSTINKSIENLSSIMLNENVIIRGDEYISYTVNDAIIEVLASQVEELNMLPGVSESWVPIDLIDPDKVSTLSTSILNAMKNIDLTEEGVDEDILSEESLSSCISKFERAYRIIERINQTVPLSSYSSYMDSSLSFEGSKFTSDVRRYMKVVEEFKDDLSGAFEDSTFAIFLTLRPDIVSNEYNVYTNNEAFQTFLNNYKILASFNSLTYALSGLDYNVIQKIIANDFDDLKEDMAFNINEGSLKFKNILPILDTSDDYVKSNHSDGSVDALSFSYNINTGKSTYLTLKSKYGKQIGKLLFESNYWDTLKQKFIGTLPSYLKMYDSKWDSTLVFWTKFNPSTDTDRIAILSFMSGKDRDFKFSIRPHSYASILKGDGEDGDEFGNISSSELKNPIFGTDNSKVKDRYSWVMWSIKFDNSTRYFENGDDNTPDFKHYIGLNVSTYTFEMSKASINSFNVVKHNLNIEPMNDLTETQVDSITKFKTPNYVWEPFISNPLSGISGISEEEYDDQFENFTINIGFSKEPTANSTNSYYYDGYFRNLTLFRGHLTTYEEQALFRLGILNDYDWSSDYDDDQLKEMINNGEFFLGLVSIYDSNNINIINCESKFNGNTYKIYKNE